MRFKHIPEAPFYLVSDEGHVRSMARFVVTYNGKVWCERAIPDTYPLKEKDIRGYKNVSIIQYDAQMRPIRRYTRQIHRLVLEAFNPVPNMKYLQVNHKDGNKANNALYNLEWSTGKENTQHAINVLHAHKTLHQNGELNNMAKLTDRKVVDILVLWSSTNLSQQEIADMFEVSRSLVGQIVRGKIWTHIDRTPYNRKV